MKAFLTVTSSLFLVGVSTMGDHGPAGGTLVNMRGSFECVSADNSGEKFTIVSEAVRFNIVDLNYASWSGLDGRTLKATEWRCERISAGAASSPLAHVASGTPDISGPAPLVSGEWMIYSPLIDHPNDSSTFGIVRRNKD